MNKNTRKIPAIPNGSFVGVSGNIGAYPVIDRPRPSIYRVLVQNCFYPHRPAQVVELTRTQISFPLRRGRYLFMGEHENFISIGGAR